ncbi:MAG: DMT family transporter [Spirochaetaceae bacterium]
MWIIFSLIATLSQVTRNLFSKQLVSSYPVMVIALSRFIYALPVVLISYLTLANIKGSVNIDSSLFFLWALLMGICQILATYFRVSLFRYKSFAVSLTIVQIDTIIVAIIGVLFLKEYLNVYAWIGLLTATTGLILASFSKNRVTLENIKNSLFTKSSLIALLTGLFLALAGVCAKQTFSYISGPNNILESLFSLSFILISEISVLLPISLYREKSSVLLLFKKPIKPMIIGICSGIGSFCWLTAYSLTNIAYVRTVGQLEFIIATLITVYYFKEKIFKLEITGMIMVSLGTLILIFLKNS